MTIRDGRAYSILVLGYHAESGTWPAARRDAVPASAPARVGSRAGLPREHVSRRRDIEARRTHPRRHLPRRVRIRPLARLSDPLFSPPPGDGFRGDRLCRAGTSARVAGDRSLAGRTPRAGAPGARVGRARAARRQRLGDRVAHPTHPPLTRLSDEELARELRESRVACERAIGRPCRSLAYPYGDFDARVTAAAEEAGYAAAAIDGLTRPRALAWPRVGVYRKDSMRQFRLKVSPTLGRIRTALGPAERQRSRLSAVA